MDSEVRHVATISPDGSVVYGPEYGPGEASRDLWAQFCAQTFFIWQDRGKELVRVRLDGQEIQFLNGYRPTPEAIELWNTMARLSPFAAPEPVTEEQA